MKRLEKILLFVALTALAAMAARVICEKAVERFFPLKYEGYIEKYAEEYGLDKYLVMGVISAESGFDSSAHSGVARGLMQITEDTAKWIAKQLNMRYYSDVVEDPEQCIKMGCFYLSYLMRQYESERTALAAYNAGMGNVASWLADENLSADGVTLGDIPYGETRRYVERVKKLERIYRIIYKT